MEQIGGVGLYNIIHFLIVDIGISSGSFILYSIYYFTIDPVYFCDYNDAPGVFTECKKKQICDFGKYNVKSYRIDYDNKFTLKNWVEQYSLECTSEFGISMIGSCFLIGAFIGSFILPRLADVVGRKPMSMLGCCLYILCCVGLIFSSNIWLLYFWIIVGGISETGRYYVNYVYAIEILPKRAQHLGGLIIFLIFGTFKICICVYFMTSKNRQWKNLAYFGIGFCAFSLILTFLYLTESPRFLFGMKRYKETNQILRRMQKMNQGRRTQLQFFDEEE